MSNIQYNELVRIDNFRTFMKRSYDYLDRRWEPEYRTEVTFVGKLVMLGNESSNSRN